MCYQYTFKYILRWQIYPYSRFKLVLWFINSKSHRTIYFSYWSIYWINYC